MLHIFGGGIILTGSQKHRIVLANQNLKFGTGPNVAISSTGITHIFIPTRNHSPSRVTRLLNSVPPRVVHLVSRAVSKVNLDSRTTRDSALIVTLTSRIYNTLHHTGGNVPPIPCPLGSRVHSLCRHRCRRNYTLLTTLGHELSSTLSPDRDITFTLRFIGTNFSANSLSPACVVANIVRRLLTIVRDACGVRLSRRSIGINHFVARLQCLFIHVRRRRRLDERPRTVVSSVVDSCTGTSGYTELVTSLVRLHLSAALARSRITCLALRITQIASRAGRGHSSSVPSRPQLTRVDR